MGIIISEMLLCLLGAGGLGALIGWLAKTEYGAKIDSSNITRSTEETTQNVVELESLWAEKLNAKDHEFESLQSQWKSEAALMEAKLSSTKATLKAQDVALTEWRNKASKYREGLAEEFEQKKAEVETTKNEVLALREQMARMESGWQTRAQASVGLEKELNLLRKEIAGKSKVLEIAQKKIVTLEALAEKNRDNKENDEGLTAIVRARTATRRR